MESEKQYLDYITDTVTKNVFIVPFNNAEAMQKVIREHRDEIAAVIMEPVLFKYWNHFATRRISRLC